jgi:exodeoxyribonuclease III
VRSEEYENPIAAEIAALGYGIHWNASTVKKGYSGTAWLTRSEPLTVTRGIGHSLDGEGRAITVEYPEFYAVSVYTPNTKDDLSRLDIRQEWDSRFCAFVSELAAKKPVVFAGDLNVAHREIDLANPKANIGKKGFTLEERAGIDRFIDAGFSDTYRHFYPDAASVYTWWSNFGQSRARNVGWRIDYAFVSSALLSRVSSAFVRAETLGSDHCPVGVELN